MLRSMAGLSHPLVRMGNIFNHFSHLYYVLSLISVRFPSHAGFLLDLRGKTSKARSGRQELVAQYKGKVKWFNNAKGYGFIGGRTGRMSSCITRRFSSTGIKR